uniref:Type II toxin-antitoxin system RelE/ParE family toxin n=1 Tax=Capnocytophaga canimorsus TaxID=28188 RepID=B6D409_9FLAO|nr:type II toxin-antitoxin system RelE/ParE family toxin [Capnocytophaga canimorsus]ACI15355.1 hypothetical protein [Capnocytophaga canimorsus]
MAIDKMYIRTNAKKSLFEALEYYREIDQKLGIQLKNEIMGCLGYIYENPYMFQKRYKDIRVCFTKIFPYAIYYIVKTTPKTQKERVYILNILHTSRKSRYKE